ncbi:MAG: paraquat-inducible protein B [Zetaproteobacteria bacterium CG12_big_fil_rev_8_21_14_0_65_54_13]|nr:MAG: paraquat-inducible protein B [Zetaproteobacteria bacterium CG23_combo_of_CG06-09_8_20_14_all_54_7]PIW50943.1 MAG: paraquat-inducible protein B [Zetaproteobacteria bacterium CG12_big_fil_rev_8_21_14_0_65_54_13]PIX54829.1 MAG: paraquat-inducible protein B [Zetaproteobacteria bacterium CG_4_10_14_3_um_filter_54_28]PJA29523.1 MAG: paraquat-inducible protein B [Zetaproteobacteria bacterium CG_4_9_14_3_um_filter_54_145]
MTEQQTDAGKGSLASPEIKRSPRISLVWLIPILTAVIGGWLIVKTIAEQEPEISITFKSAEGIEAGKTRVKYRDLDVGVVESVRLSDDFSQVELRAKISRGAETLLHKRTRFWVVKPRLGMSGISGLSTLVSGVYVALEPGDGPVASVFTGLDQPPRIMPGERGTEITLVADRLGSLDIGSPVYYQGLQAGEVLGYELTEEKKNVLVYLFIKAPFDALVHSNSHFWNVGGLDVSLGVNGVDVHVESMKSLLLGGVAFETSDSLAHSGQVEKGQHFTLFNNHTDIASNADTRGETFIAYFDNSVRGLVVGAPVEFKGITIGSVAELRLEFNQQDTSFRIPVLLEISFQRLAESGVSADVDTKKLLDQLIAKGLRAQLRTGNLLTGKLFVELDMHPDTAVQLRADNSITFLELPTIPGNFDRMATSVQNTLAKLERVDIEAIAGELQQSLRALHHLLATMDQHAGPVVVNMDQTLLKARTTLELLNRQLKAGSPAIRMTEELSETARSIRELVDMLERNPESVIIGKPKAGGK